MSKAKEGYSNHSDKNYWKNYNAKHAQLLANANQCAKRQSQVNQSFEKNETSGLNKKNYDHHYTLNCSGRYKNKVSGRWISHDHHRLFDSIKRGGTNCPVIMISLPSFNRHAYSAIVYSKRPVAKRSFAMNLMPFTEAYEIFTEKYLATVFFNQDREFEFDALNTDAIKNLVAYFIRDAAAVLNLKKGICLYGGVGTGKSTILRQLSRFTKDMNLRTMFDFIDMDDIYLGCSTGGLEHLDNYKFRSCGFDDIGMRAGNDVNSYGTKINAYQELVRSQYRRFSRPTPSLSHYTTNIVYNTASDDNKRELIRSFGARELDRFREMCNFVPLIGKSRRQYQ
ncbi:MAG: hypothetical protein ACRBFS_19640 [Aureispira sp.]